MPRRTREYNWIALQEQWYIDKVERPFIIFRDWCLENKLPYFLAKKEIQEEPPVIEPSPEPTPSPEPEPEPEPIPEPEPEPEPIPEPIPEPTQEEIDDVGSVDNLLRIAAKCSNILTRESELTPTIAKDLLPRILKIIEDREQNSLDAKMQEAFEYLNDKFENVVSEMLAAKKISKEEAEKMLNYVEEEWKSFRY
jgi:hypothetical protein